MVRPNLVAISRVPFAAMFLVSDVSYPRIDMAYTIRLRKRYELHVIDTSYCEDENAVRSTLYAKLFSMADVRMSPAAPDGRRRASCPQ